VSASIEMMNMRNANGVISPSFTTFDHSARRKPAGNRFLSDSFNQVEVFLIWKLLKPGFPHAIVDKNRDLLRLAYGQPGCIVDVGYPGALQQFLLKHCCAVWAGKLVADFASILVRSDIP